MINVVLILIFTLLFFAATTGAVISFGLTKGIPVMSFATLTAIFMVCFYLHVKRTLFVQWQKEMREEVELRKEERHSWT